MVGSDVSAASGGGGSSPEVFCGVCEWLVVVGVSHGGGGSGEEGGVFWGKRDEGRELDRKSVV